MQSVGSLEQQRKKHLFMTSDLKAISCSSLYKGKTQNRVGTLSFPNVKFLETENAFFLKDICRELYRTLEKT